MKRWPWGCLMAVAVAGAAPTAAGEPPGTAPPLKASPPASTNPGLPGIETILERWISVRGGEAAILSTTNCVAVGKAEALHLSAAARCELYARSPRQRVVMFQVPGQGTVVEGFDGESGWLDDPAFGRTEWTGEELAKRRRDATFHRDLQFRTLYPESQVKGLETVGGEPAWLLEARVSPAAEERFWFSQRTGFLLRQESTLHLALGLVERSIAYSDYRVVGRVQFPFRWQLRQRAASQAEPEVTVTIQFDDVRFNVPLPDARFRRGSVE